MKLVYSESTVLASCLELLELRGVRAWRNNSGAALTESGGKRRFIRYGLKGSSDIIGVLPISGRFLAVETKRPEVYSIGQKAGTLRGPQRAFLKSINESGGVGVCVDCVLSLSTILDTLARWPMARFDIKGVVAVGVPNCGPDRADMSAPDDEESPF